MAESTKSARELNEEFLYTSYSVFRAARPLPADRTALSAEVDDLLEQALAKDLYTRGSYHASGYRADAALVFWWTCPVVDPLKEPYSLFRRTGLGRHFEPFWSSYGVH